MCAILAMFLPSFRFVGPPNCQFGFPLRANVYTIARLSITTSKGWLQHEARGSLLISPIKSYECFDHAPHERKISNDLKSLRSSSDVEGLLTGFLDQIRQTTYAGRSATGTPESIALHLASSATNFCFAISRTSAARA